MTRGPDDKKSPWILAASNVVQGVLSLVQGLLSLVQGFVSLFQWRLSLAQWSLFENPWIPRVFIRTPWNPFENP